MQPKQLTLAALLAASVAGNIYLIDKGEYAPVVVAEAVPATAVEVKGAEATVLDEAMQKAGATEVECETMVDSHPLSDKTPRVFCHGGTAGFWVDGGTLDGKVTLLSGKVYSNNSPAAQLPPLSPEKP